MFETTKTFVVVWINNKDFVASINLNSGRLLSQIINKSHPINPLNNSDRLFALSNISFASIPDLKDHEYSS